MWIFSSSSFVVCFFCVSQIKETKKMNFLAKKNIYNKFFNTLLLLLLLPISYDVLWRCCFSLFSRFKTFGILLLPLFVVSLWHKKTLKKKIHQFRRLVFFNLYSTVWPKIHAMYTYIRVHVHVLKTSFFLFFSRNKIHQNYWKLAFNLVFETRIMIHIL